ncbi:MAG: DegV family protein [Acidobacteriota bacterium]
MSGPASRTPLSQRARPALLVVDPITERRRALSRALAAAYEVVPALDAEEGERYAQTLGPAVIVMPAPIARGAGAWVLAERYGDPSVAQSVVLLGSGDPAEAEEIPESTVLLPAHGLARNALITRIRLALLAREAGLAPDAHLEALLGDLSQISLIELVQLLSRMHLSARVDLPGRGHLRLAEQTLHSAATGKVQGIKAFCRLCRLTEGPFRVVLEPHTGEDCGELSAALIAAIEDSLGDYPPPTHQLVLNPNSIFFETSFSKLAQAILVGAHGGQTVQEVFDGLPQTDGEILSQLNELEDLGSLSLQPPSTPVHIVTDSTADLPPDLAAKYGIEVVPLTVLFGKERLLDRVDLQPGPFYERLADRGPHPTTEPPAAETIGRRYRRQSTDRMVLSLHISSELSQTPLNARRAAMEWMDSESPNFSPRVIDSRLVSLPLGFLSLFAARMAGRGIAVETIEERLLALRERFHTFFVVDSLEFLARGGRIGKARAFLGGLLNIKPILGLDDGRIVPVDRVRGGRAAHPRILELLRDGIDPERPVLAGIAHAAAPVWADRLRGLIEDEFQVKEMIVAEMGPVVGAHVGPGTIGATLFQPLPAEDDLLPTATKVPQ